ncbi:MAG TPA: hypothetical protein VK186_22200 [Candidatus Deferrimicrobium sp.]|nr:hypothetical protein [Candidatus Deferrimicrobium sp.]
MCIIYKYKRCVLSLVLMAAFSSLVWGVIPALEREALINFYNSTNGDQWVIKSGWKTPPLHTDGFAMPGTEGSWYGITVQDDHVIQINLEWNQLTSIMGVIPPAIGNLGNLRLLRLEGFQLTGNIPPEIGNLGNLQTLILDLNDLNGSIPPELGNLSNLQNLNLGFNYLSGSIPPELGNLVNLQELSLYYNQLSGSIPSQLGNLGNLKILCLSYNPLSGNIPSSFGNLINLESLSLELCTLNGIPTELGNLSKLKVLNLHNAQLRGIIPPQLGNLMNLQSLYLDYNQLSGSIPPELGNLGNLQSLNVNTNKLNGEIPTSLTNLIKVTALDIGYNCLQATDPTLRSWLNTHDPDWEAHQNQCEEAPTITVTSPNGGERWMVGSSHAITWTTTGTVANVKIEYSRSKGSSWEIITASTANTGSYTWTIPDTVSSHCRIKISDASDGTPTDTGDAFFSIIKPPIIQLNRTKLHFCATSPEKVTGPQEIWINNGGGEILNWSLISDSSWLTGSPDQGTGNGIISVSVNPMGLAEGTYTGAIAVSDPTAVNSPQTVSVTLKVKSNSEDMAPFGEFLTPLDNLTVGSSIPVTGWVLDDVGIQSVKIYREEADAQLVFIGDAVLVEGARPDVEGAFPDFPNNYKAGWGYMLLTNFLPNGGNGVFKLHAIVEDMAGNSIDLGVKTITVDNANAVKPFGAIDTPTQGGTASGSSFINWGWVLTPRPNIIPANGSTIHVWVDGIDIGHPVYNNYREDIAAMFPGYANSNRAVGYFYLNTAPYENGIHTLSWTATDSGGNTDGIGSRYFAVQNNGTDQGSREKHKGNPAWSSVFDTRSSIPDRDGAVRVKKGFDSDIKTQEMYPDDNGIITIEIKELERVEIHFRTGSTVNLSPLPIGSTFDSTKGVFYWQPGPGFVGAYRFVFVEKDEAGQVNQEDIIINIMPI